MEIVVDQGENETILTAHQMLLLESPFLAEAVTKLDGPSRVSPLFSFSMFRDGLWLLLI